MLNFEILIDNLFANVNTDSSLFPIGNKRVLSIINDFENKKWRFQNFQNFVWDNIAETALSYRERQGLVNQSHSTLTEAAKKLRLTDEAKDEPGKGSELAEIVLYGIMKHHFGALPVVPKIFYKQNAQDNAKGSDSVHIVIDNKDDFTIWFGEAKFYNSIEDARLPEIIKSVEESLDIEKLKKEKSIITSVSDLDLLDISDGINKAIRDLLKSDGSIDNLKPKLHIPILLLHECEITKAQTEMSDTYKNDLVAYHKDRSYAYFKKQITKMGGLHKYSDITFHIILFPVFSKKEIVSKFISNVKHYKSQ